MTFDHLNKSFNIETMKLEEPEETYTPALFTRVSKKQRQFIIKQGGNRSGRGCSYPWKDPNYEVGDSFWKPVSLKEWEEGTGRPNVPHSNKVGGRLWKTYKAYREDTKQYGYFVERIQ